MWSITRGNGEGRSIDLYQVFAELLREDSKERTVRATTELRTLLKEILHHEDMRRSQMKRSKSFVAEIMVMIDRQHETFLTETGPIGLASLKQGFQNDHVFWDECAQLWGRGGGFRAQIAKRTEQWFRRHPRLTERMDDRLQDLWNATFVEWLRSYLADNTDVGGRPQQHIDDPHGGNMTKHEYETRVVNALEALEVVAVADVVETDTTGFATHLLPCLGQLERCDLSASSATRRLRDRRKWHAVPR